MVSSPLKASTLHNMSPLNLRCRLSGHRESHLVANFEPVLSAKKINSARRADNNGTPKKSSSCSVNLGGLASRQANKPRRYLRLQLLRIRAFCCEMHWWKARGGRVMVSHDRCDSFLSEFSPRRQTDGRGSCLQVQWPQWLFNRLLKSP